MTDGDGQPAPTRRRRAVGVVLLLGLALTALPGRASADAISDKRAEAKRIAAQREQLTQDAERLNEQAKQTEDELDRLDAQVADTTAQLASQQSTTATLNKQAADLAINAYMHGDASSGLAAVMADDGAVNLQLARGYTPVALGGSTDVIDQARASVQDTQRLVDQLSAQKAEQERLTRTLAQRQRGRRRRPGQAHHAGVEGQRRAHPTRGRGTGPQGSRSRSGRRGQAEGRGRGPGPQGRAELKARSTTTVATTVATTAAPTARTAATAPAGGGKAAVAARHHHRHHGQGQDRHDQGHRHHGGGRRRRVAHPGHRGAGAHHRAAASIPAASPAAGIAVAEALRQLGKRYVFNTAGPDTFDCSGLTMWAWATAGVSMPHYTVSQFQAFPHVPLDQLQPGDLVFFNLNLGHVGMYIGGGKIVHAPRTGDVVKISVLAGRNVVGAIRPG